VGVCERELFYMNTLHIYVYASINDCMLMSYHGMKGVVLIKLCEFGTVSSENWISGYVVIERGVLKVFDESKSSILGR
jgi:hypothetical protein